MSEHDLSIIDISHWQTVVRPESRPHLVGIIHKATEDTSMVDGNYAARRAGALALGLKFASYHFLHPDDIEQQMRFYLANAKPLPGERVVIDYEHEDLVLDDLREAVRWIDEIDPTLQITIYGGGLLRDQLGDDNDPYLAQCALWIAHYTTASAPDWPKGTWPTWSLWQYSDGVNGGTPQEVEGIDGPCDCNVFNGSRENCAKWMGPVTEEPDVEDRLVTIDIYVPEGVDVKVNVTGPGKLEGVSWPSKSSSLI